MTRGLRVLSTVIGNQTVPSDLKNSVSAVGPIIVIAVVVCLAVAVVVSVVVAFGRN